MLATIRAALTKQSRFPESLVLVFALIVAAQLASYVLPAGEFARAEVDGHLQVVKGTYRVVDAPPLPWHSFLTSIPRGLAKASDIVFFVFVCGGTIGLVRATGALDAFVAAALRVFGGRPALLVAGMVAVFAVGASTIGMSEEYVPFVPVLLAMCLALKLDGVVAVAIANVGSAVGYGAAALNPFTVIVAQRIAHVPLTSGWAFRCVLLVAVVAVAAHHIASYARAVRRDPTRSLVRDVDYSDVAERASSARLEARHKLVLLAFAAGIVVLVAGVARWEWGLGELAAVFLAIALASAAIGRFTPNLAAREFTAGAAEMTGTALLIGFARTIQVVLDDAHVIDTLVNALAQPIESFGPTGAALAMLGAQSATGLVIASGSGQAYVMMPIMTQLADLTHVSRQTAVLAFQIGDGFMNVVVPSSGVLMGMLGLGRVPFTRWLRFVVPLLAKLYVVAIAAMIAAVAIGY